MDNPGRSRHFDARCPQARNLVRGQNYTRDPPEVSSALRTVFSRTVRGTTACRTGFPGSGKCGSRCSKSSTIATAGQKGSVSLLTFTATILRFYEVAPTPRAANRSGEGEQTHGSF